jgi:uncharacterized protein
VLAPRFRKGDYAGGIEAASRAMIAATKGEYRSAPRRRGTGGWVPLAYVVLILIAALISAARRAQLGGQPRGRGRRSSGPFYWGGGGFGGGSGGGFGGGGFSGGGGCSGGGGASGGW